MQVTHATVQESAEDRSIVYGDTLWQGGGDISALRAYQAFHPSAAIYTVTFNGRTVWMTSKQHAIWYEAKKYHMRGMRRTLEAIAKKVGCSRATVSRFLRRLDLWRFIDLASLQGRKGGTYIFTRTGKGNEADFNASGARHTMSSRRRARVYLAARVKQMALARLQPFLEAVREPRSNRWWSYAEQITLGSTGATFRASNR